MELIDFKDNCRLCLKRHTDFMKNIHTYCIEGYQGTLVQSIFALFKVELYTHKDYPQFICRKCLTELENILLFKEDLQHNQHFLLELFRAAYPNYIEKNLHTPNVSKDSDTKFNSVAVNTETEINLENLGDSEYVKVPVSFLKQFLPQVDLQHTDVRCLSNQSPEIRQEIIHDDSLRSDRKVTVNMCKYCSKVFRSQALANTHCKEVHTLDEQKKNIETKKRNSIQTNLSKKIKSEEDITIFFGDLQESPPEQVNLPEIDLQNNNPVVKEEVLDGPTNHQVNEIKLNESVYPEKQALFLQNFDLIAKQGAAILKARQKYLEGLPQSAALKKRIKKNKQTVVKSVRTKKKLMAKPVGSCRRGRPRKINQDILSRSVQFLQRYGWRKFKSTSRQGTPTKFEPSDLFERKNVSVKSVSKKVNPKNRFKSSQTAQPQNTCLSSNVKRSNSVESLGNRSFKTEATFNSNRNSLKNSPTSSVISKSQILNCFNENIDNIKPPESELVIKDEVTVFSKEEDQENKEFATTSLRSYHDNDKVSIEHDTDIRGILDKRNFNLRLVDPTLKSLDACKQKKLSSKRKSHVLIKRKESEELLNSHAKCRASCDSQEPQTGLEPKCLSETIDSFLPLNDLDIKKELRIQLTRECSPAKHNGFNGTLFEKHNFEIFKKNLGISHSGANINKVSKRRGRPKKNVDSRSINNISRWPKKRGRPFKNPGKNYILINNIYNHLEKKNIGLNTPINNRTILKLNGGSAETSLANEDLTVVTKKPGRPRKKTPALLDATQSQLGCLPASTQDIKNKYISTLQALTDRCEKGDNISLRSKLRKTASCENLNCLKYDTQELDENFQIKTEAIREYTNIEYNNVPDNKILFTSHDGIGYDAVGNIALKDKEITPEKVVNIDLEDGEVQMVVPISDEEDISFDNDDIIDYFESRKSRLNLKPIDFGNKSRTYSSLKESARAAIIDEGKCIAQQKQINRSQTSLSYNKIKLKEPDGDLRKKIFTNTLINMGQHSKVIPQTTPSKRRGRPPNKFSLQVKKRGRPSKKDRYNISTVIQKDSSTINKASTSTRNKLGPIKSYFSV